MSDGGGRGGGSVFKLECIVRGRGKAKQLFMYIQTMLCMIMLCSAMLTYIVRPTHTHTNCMFVRVCVFASESYISSPEALNHLNC